MERTLVAQDWVENKNIKNQRTVEPEMRKSQGADRDTADSTHIAHTLAAVIQKSEGTSDASLAKLDWTSRNWQELSTSQPNAPNAFWGISPGGDLPLCSMEWNATFQNQWNLARNFVQPIPKSTFFSHHIPAQINHKDLRAQIQGLQSRPKACWGTAETVRSTTVAGFPAKMDAFGCKIDFTDIQSWETSGSHTKLISLVEFLCKPGWTTGLLSWTA